MLVAYSVLLVCINLYIEHHHHQQQQWQSFHGLFSRTSWVGWYQKDKPLWIFLKQRWSGGSGINWSICKSFAPRSRQITMPAPHHSRFFTVQMLFNQRCQHRHNCYGDRMVLCRLKCTSIHCSHWHVPYSVKRVANLSSVNQHIVPC